MDVAADVIVGGNRTDNFVADVLGVRRRETNPQFRAYGRDHFKKPGEIHDFALFGIPGRHPLGSALTAFFPQI